MEDKPFDDKAKYQLECKKLDREITQIEKPFYKQTGLLLALLPLLFSLAFNLQQCQNRKDEKESIELDIKRDSWTKDSIKRQIVINEGLLIDTKTANSKATAENK